ncbi:hypothetical protein [Acinetobacter sp. B51(2017)]|nr:hypothetical protein [Acinetobacter sp. B51(2017)]
MLNKLFLTISLWGLLATASYANNALLASEVALCSNGFDDVDVCQLRS